MPLPASSMSVLELVRGIWLILLYLEDFYCVQNEIYRISDLITIKTLGINSHWGNKYFNNLLGIQRSNIAVKCHG